MIERFNYGGLKFGTRSKNDWFFPYEGAVRRGVYALSCTLRGGGLVGNPYAENG
jgi:hypothetical protein